ncbi:MFS transporter [Sphingomonas sp. PP-CE-3G-477]|uniref:MFS transporter n=1 Tax=Sphingomonas sp. PP-CE-3G-477 TaxID=2135660 RepID=UPI000D352E35|nr:MFS transporter [Sphingomonas sp. PP-CE-3G-477]PTQ64180.1 MFS transporter [Sphingomonas sp. PP-CE-3G-477]
MARLPASRVSAPGSDRRSTLFLLVFALAYVGGVVGYLPLLTLLLPIKVDAVVTAIGGAGRLDVLTVIVVAGALAASVSNIAFGWLSDRSVARGRGRRGWLAGGFVATAIAYAAMAVASTPIALILAVVAFQVAVNAVLAPLLAIMADEVPDAQKGVAGGLLAVASPVASALAALLVATALLSETLRLAIVPVVVACCIVPLLLTPAQPIARIGTTSPIEAVRRDLALAWSARLFVQVAGSALFVYLFYYLESIAPSVAPGRIAARMGMVMIVAYTVPLPIAVLIGRLADRSGRTKPFLFAATLVAASGLCGMAFANDFTRGAVAFCVYTAGASVFLALHASFAMQLLPNPLHRGRDLGLLNLTNTLPGLLGPTLTWALATPTDFDAVMLVLAALTLCGGGIILAARGRR